eukprot:CFRG3889T1
MGKKKERKFQVVFHISQLSSIPSVNGSLRASLQLGKRKLGITHRRDISNFKVNWDQTFEFKCVIQANIQELLQPCLCQVKIYKETRFGSYKIGFVKVDLAEFAGQGEVERRYILSGDESHKRRRDNSILQIKATLFLVSGDPLFKVPEIVDNKSITGPTYGLQKNVPASLDYSRGAEADTQSSNNNIPRAPVTRLFIASTRINPKTVIDDIITEQLQMCSVGGTQPTPMQNHTMRYSELNIKSI